MVKVISFALRPGNARARGDCTAISIGIRKRYLTWLEGSDVRPSEAIAAGKIRCNTIWVRRGDTIGRVIQTPQLQTSELEQRKIWMGDALKYVFTSAERVGFGRWESVGAMQESGDRLT